MSKAVRGPSLVGALLFLTSLSDGKSSSDLLYTAVTRFRQNESEVAYLASRLSSVRLLFFTSAEHTGQAKTFFLSNCGGRSGLR